MSDDTSKSFYEVHFWDYASPFSESQPKILPGSPFASLEEAKQAVVHHLIARDSETIERTRRSIGLSRIEPDIEQKFFSHYKVDWIYDEDETGRYWEPRASLAGTFTFGRGDYRIHEKRGSRE